MGSLDQLSGPILHRFGMWGCPGVHLLQPCSAVPHQGCSQQSKRGLAGQTPVLLTLLGLAWTLWPWGPALLTACIWGTGREGPGAKNKAHRNVDGREKGGSSA